MHNVLGFDILVDYFESVHHSQSQKQILLHLFNFERSLLTELQHELATFFIDYNVKTKGI